MKDARIAGYAKCAYCGGRVRVTRAGKLWRHKQFQMPCPNAGTEAENVG